MSSERGPLRKLSTIVVASAALLALGIAACGDDSSSDGAAGTGGAAGTAGQTSGGTSGGSKAGGGSGGSGTSGSGSAGKGGSGSGSGGSGSGGSGSGGTSATAGSGGQNATDGGPPGPADGGVSPYTVQCDEMTPCGTPGVTCLGIFLEEGGARFTCSNQCQTVQDCSDAPTGAEAEVGCVQFEAASRCVLVCYDNGTEHDCPAGMGCYRYTDFPIGYCLWL